VSTDSSRTYITAARRAFTVLTDSMYNLFVLTSIIMNTHLRMEPAVLATCARPLHCPPAAIQETIRLKCGQHTAGEVDGR
jgi:hypothetical protein